MKKMSVTSTNGMYPSKKIKQIELDCLADNEYERIRAQQEFILESNDLDLEGLSTLIKNRREKYDEQNKDVLANYNTQIEYLKNHLGEMDYETRIAAEAQIEQLEKDIYKIYKEETK